MEAIKRYPNYINSADSIFVGIIVTFASIAINGYGAAVAIPKSILEPIALFSPTLAFALVDLITIGLPFALVFALLAWATSFLRIKANHNLMAMPFVLFMLFSSFDLFASAADPLFYLASLLVRVLPVVLCALFLTKHNKVTNSA